MTETVKEKTTPKKDHTSEPLPTGAGEGTPFDSQTVESIGIKFIKKFGKLFLSAENQATLGKISDTNVEGCLDFLSSLDYNQNKTFLNCIHRASYACVNNGAAALVACGASEAHSSSREIIFESITKNPELFHRVVEELVSKQPFPQKAFRLVQKKHHSTVAANFTAAKVKALEGLLGKLFLEKGCTEYAKVRIKENKHMIGLMIEHANPETHLPTVDTTSTPAAAFENLRVRTSDFVWVDKHNKMLWTKSGLMIKRYKDRFLTALGEFFCNDATAFAHEHSPNLTTFNSPAVVSALNSLNIPGIKKVEMRELFYRKTGVNRGNENQLSGPEKKGCITDMPDWTKELPPQWQTREVHLAIETVAGDREWILISSRSITLEHTPSLSLSIALLKHLKVIPNYDN